MLTVGTAARVVTADAGEEGVGRFDGYHEADRLPSRVCQRRPISAARDPLRAISGQASETLQKQRRSARNSPDAYHACKAQLPPDIF